MTMISGDTHGNRTFHINQLMTTMDDPRTRFRCSLSSSLRPSGADQEVYHDHSTRIASPPFRRRRCHLLHLITNKDYFSTPMECVQLFFWDPLLNCKLGHGSNMFPSARICVQLGRTCSGALVFCCAQAALCKMKFVSFRNILTFIPFPLSRQDFRIYKK